MYPLSFFCVLFLLEACAPPPNSGISYNWDHVDECVDNIEEPQETDLSEIFLGYRIRLSFVGDLFWGRGVDVRSQKTQAGYAYPFEQLSTFAKQDHEVWIGNLECPVTSTQETYERMKKLLKFSCKPEYLSFAREYFDIFSLANNHTDNMQEVGGFEQTKEFLQTHNFQYFGSFDNRRQSDICEVVSVPAEPINALGNRIENKPIFNFPIALCGYHNVLKLPTEAELAVITDYSTYFFTIVMPHQGVEYKARQNHWQEEQYRKMINYGADMVVGGHTHSIQGLEWYKGKPIVYSVGNFIFDQNFGTTMYGLMYRLQMFVSNNEEIFTYQSWGISDCTKFQDQCLYNAEYYSLQKPKVSLVQAMDIVHNLHMQPQKAADSIAQTKLKDIGWHKYIQDTTQTKQ